MDKEMLKGHNWFYHRKFRLTVCKHCGIVQRHDKNNKPCPGKVRVGLRENRIKAATPSNGEIE